MDCQFLLVCPRGYGDRRLLTWHCKMDHNKKEQISSIFLILFSVFICFFSYKLSIGSIHNPGAGFFPFYLGIILGLLSIKNFTKAIAQRKITIKAIKTSDTDINWKNIIITVVVLFCLSAVVQVSWVFQYPTFLFTALFLRFIEPPEMVGRIGYGRSRSDYFLFRFPVLAENSIPFRYLWDIANSWIF